MNSIGIVYSQGLQVCKWYLLWGLKSINRTYFGLFGGPGIGTGFRGDPPFRAQVSAMRSQLLPGAPGAR